MKLGYDLHIEQTQKLIMTPELIQAIQILQFTNQELESYIEEQLLSNPILETTVEETSADSKEEVSATGQEEVSEPPFDWSEYLKEYDDISYRQNEYTRRNYESSEEIPFEQMFSSDETLADHLMLQLQLTDLDEHRKEIAAYIIESLDKNGYMCATIREVADAANTDEFVAEEVLKVIQTFDPVGVSARNLEECLLIQVEQLGINDQMVRKAIENHMQDIAENRISNISKCLGISCKRAQSIADIIKKLEPKPGRKFSDNVDIRYIVPDVFVERTDNGYSITVNDSSIPRLYVSSYYKKVLQEEDKESNTSKFLTNKLNSAVWLIKSIEQRRRTIQNVVAALVKYQKDFFDHGKKHLKPLTLRQVAEEIGAHESTVSRAISGKYLQSPRGVYDIKFFFSSGVYDNLGQGVASEGIKTYIKEMIEAENPQKPISDQYISEILMQKGIDISRRTVAKYRDEINIPSSSKRKRY